MMAGGALPVDAPETMGIAQAAPDSAAMAASTIKGWNWRDPGKSMPSKIS
jgi:hypothetical protein